MRFVVRIDDSEKTVDIVHNNGFFDLEIDGQPFKVDCQYMGDSDYLSLLIDNKSYLIETGPVKADEGRYYARVMGRHYDVDVLDELLAAARDAAAAEEHTGAYTVSSPMPGRIVDIKVAVGDHVHAGDAIVIMEAMKMQNELSTEVAGVVKEIKVSEQQTIDSQVPLVVIEKE